MTAEDLVSIFNGQCRHHWLVEPPKGETSKAVCKLCGATREFSNNPEAAFTVARRTSPSRIFVDSA
jgi:hypothetical protein